MFNIFVALKSQACGATTAPAMEVLVETTAADWKRLLQWEELGQLWNPGGKWCLRKAIQGEAKYITVKPLAPNIQRVYVLENMYWSMQLEHFHKRTSTLIVCVISLRLIRLHVQSAWVNDSFDVTQKNTVFYNSLFQRTESGKVKASNFDAPTQSMIMMKRMFAKFATILNCIKQFVFVTRIFATEPKRG